MNLSQQNGFAPEQPRSPQKAIQEYCKWCSGRIWEDGKYIQESYPSQCTVKSCPLWPFRSGKNPFRKGVSAENRAAAAERMKGYQLKKKELV